MERSQGTLDVVSVFDRAAEEYANVRCPGCGDFVFWDGIGEHSCFRSVVRVRVLERLLTPDWM